jgi:hypothetical protein
MGGGGLAVVYFVLHTFVKVFLYGFDMPGYVGVSREGGEMNAECSHVIASRLDQSTRVGTRLLL